MTEGGTRARWVTGGGFALAAVCLLFVGVVLSALTGLDLGPGRAGSPRATASPGTVAGPLTVPPSTVDGATASDERVSRSTTGRLALPAPPPPASEQPQPDEPGAVAAGRRTSPAGSAVVVHGSGDGTASGSARRSRQGSGRAEAAGTTTAGGSTDTPGRTSAEGSAGSSGSTGAPPAPARGHRSNSDAGSARPSAVPGSGTGTARRPAEQPRAGASR